MSCLTFSPHIKKPESRRLDLKKVFFFIIIIMIIMQAERDLGIPQEGLKAATLTLHRL